MRLGPSLSSSSAPSLILDLMRECVCVCMRIYECACQGCVHVCVCVSMQVCLERVSGCFLLCLCVHGDAKTKKDDTNTFTFTVAKFLGQA